MDKMIHCVLWVTESSSAVNKYSKRIQKVHFDMFSRLCVLLLLVIIVQKLNSFTIINQSSMEWKILWIVENSMDCGKSHGLWKILWIADIWKGVKPYAVI